MIRIEQIYTGKKRFLELLLLADPDEDMIDRYLEEGDLFVLYDDGFPASEVVALKRDDGALEIKSLATAESFQRRGHAARLIRYVEERYAQVFDRLYVGTADMGAAYYERLGFERAYVVPNFFTDNYPEPVIDRGIQCVDMVYLVKKMRGGIGL